MTEASFSLTKRKQACALQRRCQDRGDPDLLLFGQAFDKYVLDAWDYGFYVFEWDIFFIQFCLYRGNYFRIVDSDVETGAEDLN